MHGLRCGATQSATPTDNPPDYPAEHGPTRNQQRKSWADQQTHYAHTPDDQDQRSADPTATPIRGSRLSGPSGIADRRDRRELFGEFAEIRVQRLPDRCGQVLDGAPPTNRVALVLDESLRPVQPGPDGGHRGEPGGEQVGQE